MTTKALKGKRDWSKLHLNNNSSIDYSEIPATTEEFWVDADVFLLHNKYSHERDREDHNDNSK